MRLFIAVTMLYLMTALPLVADQPSGGENDGLFSTKITSDGQYVPDTTYIPPIEVYAEIVPEGSVRAFVPGVSYPMRLEVFNPMEEAVPSPRFGMAAGGEIHVQLEQEDTPPPTAINAITRVKRNFTVVFPDKSVGYQVPIRGQVWYKWKGADYYADCVIQVPIIPAFEVNALPKRLVAPGPHQIGISIINHTANDAKVLLSFDSPEGVSIRPATAELEVASSGLDARVASVSADESLPVGKYRVTINADGKPTVGIDVDVPAIAAAKTVAVDGDLSDWSGDAVKFGKADTSSLRFAWDEDNLYVAVETSLHKAQSVLVAVDPLMDGSRPGVGGYREDDVEIVLKMTEGKSICEAEIPWSRIPSFKPDVGKALGVAVVVKSSAEGNPTACWGDGVLGPKNPDKFMAVRLGQP